MPGGIVSDDDFWRLLSEREIVREPIVDRYERGFRPIGTFSGPGRLASPYEGLIRDGREMLFDRNLFGMSHNEMPTADPHVRMLGDLRARKVGTCTRCATAAPACSFGGGSPPAAAHLPVLVQHQHLPGAGI